MNNVPKSELEKFLSGERKENLTNSEIRDFFTFPINDENNFILITALKRKIPGFPNNAIIYIVDNAKSMDSLLPFCWTIKFGADANGYIADPKHGPSHIILYILNTLAGKTDDILIKSFISALIISGSRLSSPAFDQNANKIGTTNAGGQSVTEWVRENYNNFGISNLTSSEEMLKNYLGEELLTTVGIYLDKFAYKGRKYTVKDVITTITAFAFNTVWGALPVKKNDEIFSDVNYSNICINKYCHEGFEKLLELGMYSDYNLINKIINSLKKNKGRNLILNELGKFIVSAIKYGARIDQVQLNLIMESELDILTEINNEYNIPFWRKECKNGNKDISENMRGLAFSLNVQSKTKEGICTAFQTLSSGNRDFLIDANKRRQTGKMNYKLGNTTDFTNGGTPDLRCQNYNNFTRDPFDGNDLDMSYYKDENDKVWCYTSESYESLIKSGTNNSIYKPLPPDFIEEIKMKKNHIDSLKSGEDNYVTKSFSKALDELSEKDTISNKLSDKFYERFQQLAIKNNVDSDKLKNISPSNYESALLSVSSNIPVKDLDSELARYTVARIVTSFDQNKTKSFFEYIKNIQQSY